MTGFAELVPAKTGEDGFASSADQGDPVAPIILLVQHFLIGDVSDQKVS